jgi:hypothetical protein
LALILKALPPDPMIAPLSVRTVLPTWLARFFAAAIIVLAVSPFTAPFSTFDAAEIASDQVLHAGDAQVKIAQDTTDFVFNPASAIPTALETAFDGAALSNRLDVRPIRVLVLRI